ncbi:hypothetical protein QE429_004116 [Bacillus sp. SORGH_AS 510]|uniref:C39 family peptidase n=1 Tax=Bacillus sp. SORGH_AS_0510 TaxID=3041771 RepID=UPI002781F331|nr:C39 family peptidase [Bacillus sp. SORGH_AS_0510]MDQ1147289.1 hypothetical protein [Bacillus sp. SORGH_AS_0510]
MKNIFVSLCISVLLLSFGFGPIKNAKAEEVIPLDIAKQAALNHLEQSIYADEIDSVDDLHFKTNLYDIDETLLGYYLTYTTREGSINHILISASTNLAPVLQHGEGPLDDEYEYLLEKGKKIYYLGPLQFLYGNNKDEVNEKFNKKKDEWLKDLEKQNKKDTKEYEKLRKTEIPRVKKKSKHKDEWETLLSYDPNQLTTTATTYKVLSVTRLSQRSSGVNNPNSACGPTTAAMVANYLKSQGYNVRGLSDYSSTGAFINHMYNELGTTIAGSSISDYTYGLYKHVQHNYSTDKWDTWSYRAYGNYTHYKDNILNNKPVGLRFDLWIKEGAYENYHFVAGIGFNHGSVAEFAIKDPDGSNGGTIWLNWNDNNDDMAMGLVNYIP